MKFAAAGILSLEPPAVVFARIGRHAGGGRIEEFLSEPCTAEAGTDGTEADHWRSTCGRLAARARYRGPVTLLLPSHLLLAKHVKLPAVTGARRERALRFAATEAIPFALADVVWDGVAAGSGPTGENVLLLAARRERVERLCAAAEAAGFQPSAVQAAPLAALAAHRLGADGARSTELLLTWGAKAHELVLVGPAGFRLRIIAARGEAEQGQGAAWLAAEVERTLRHFQIEAAPGFTPPAKVVLAATPAPPGLTTELGSRLGLPVEPQSTASGEPSFGDEIPEWWRWRLRGAAALASQTRLPGAELLPAPRLERQRSRRRLPWLAGAAALSLAAMLPPIARHRAETANLRVQRAQLEAELAEPRARDAHNRAQLARWAELRRQTAALDGLMERKDRWVGFLTDLQDRLGRVEDVWLDRLEIAPAEPSEAAGKAPLRLAVAGRMLNRTGPLERWNRESYGRVKVLLASVEASPWVGAVERERVERLQDGIVRFEFEVLAHADRLL